MSVKREDLDVRTRGYICTQALMYAQASHMQNTEGDYEKLVEFVTGMFFQYDLEDADGLINTELVLDVTNKVYNFYIENYTDGYVVTVGGKDND